MKNDTPAPDDVPRAPTAPVRHSRWTALALALALIAHGLLLELLIAPTGRGTLALKVLPLLLALPGLWRMRLYTYRWLSLAVWLYAAEGGVRVLGERAPAGPALALSEIVLAVLLFAACAWHVRARLAAGRLQVAEKAAEPAA